MNIKKLLMGGAACATLLAVTPAAAVELPVNGGWFDFSFGDVGSGISPTFEFTLASTATFKITDAYLDGDQFEIFINGVSYGLTSNPANDGTSASNNFDAAFASPLFSHGSYVLGPGTYSVSANVVLSPYGGGGGGAQLVSGGAVPETATWALMLGGFGLVGSAMRGGRKSAVSFG